MKLFKSYPIVKRRTAWKIWELPDGRYLFCDLFLEQWNRKSIGIRAYLAESDQIRYSPKTQRYHSTIYQPEKEVLRSALDDNAAIQLYRHVNPHALALELML